MINTFKTKFIKSTLLLCCCLLANAANSQTQTYTICTDDSVTIFEEDLALQLAGPPGPPGTYNCTNFRSSIEPNDESVERIGERFILRPSVNTTYTITSTSGPIAPGDACRPREVVNIIEVIVEDCDSELDSYTICAGESAIISDQDLTLPPPPPQGPPGTYSCNNLYRSIQPNDEGVERDGNGYILSPTVTTIYTINSSTGPAGPGDSCIPSEVYTDIIEVIVEDCTNETSYCDQPLSFTQLSDLTGGITAGPYGKVVLQHYGPILGYYYEIRNICPVPSIGPGSIPYSSGYYNCSGEYLCSNGGLVRCEIPVNEATETQLLKTLDCETSGTEHQICAGESVLLSSTGYFAGNPSSVPDNYPQTYNCGTTQLSISPSSNTLISEDGFTVNPTVTTTYTITSTGESDTCPIQSSVHTVIVDNCEPNPDTFTICAGEVVTLSDQDLSVPPPPFFGANFCNNLFRSITPGDTNVERDGNGFILSPNVSTTYTVTSWYGPAGPGHSCSPSEQITNIIEVIVEPCPLPEDENNYQPGEYTIEGCIGDEIDLNLSYYSPDDNICSPITYFFDIDRNTNLPIISNYTQTDDCNISFTFNGEGQFVYQGGTSRYAPEIGEWKFNLKLKENCISEDEIITICKGESATINLNLDDFDYQTGCFNCIPLRFAEINWLENGTNISNESSITVSPAQSTTYTVDITVESGCLGSPSPYPCGVSPFPYRSYSIIYKVEVIEDCDSSEQPILIKYPWLTTNIGITASSCEGTSIIEYDAGSYSFIQVIDATGSSLYYENGAFYCKDQPNYSCVDIYNLTNIVDDSFGCSILLIPGCIDPDATNYNPEATIDDGSCEYDENENTVFSDYPWLNTIVNQNNCNTENITVYYGWSNNNLIEIQSILGTDLYYQNGTYLCSDTPDYSCAAAYNLSNVAASWSCGNTSTSICDLAPDPGPCEGNERRFYYDKTAGDCLTFQYGGCEGNDNNFNNYFVCIDKACVQPVDCPQGEPLQWDWVQDLIADADVSYINHIETFNADGNTYVSLTYDGEDTPIDYFSCKGNYVCFINGFLPPGSDSGCSFTDISNRQTIWSKGTSIQGCTDPEALNYNPQATQEDNSCTYQADCKNHNGTFFFEDCGGYNYYFIQLEDGRIFDPYFADNISFNPFEGQQVSLDFVYNTEIVTPCSVSQAPITITCIEEVRGYPFEVYPWLSSIVDPNNCNGTTVSIYDAGSYDFIGIQTTAGTDLYYQNGTYYCSDAPGYSCVQAYNLNNVVDTWNCTNINTHNNCNVENLETDLPWLAERINQGYNSEKIESYIYDGQLVFAVSIFATDAGTQVYNCSGALICDSGFGSSIRCSDFPDNATFVKEIYNGANNNQTFNFNDYPWLDAIVNPVNCNQQPVVTEYDFGNYAFIYIKTVTGGSLYLNNGSFYCSDLDGQTCLNNYSLIEATTTWTCSNEEFQKFDYVYTICEGESVTLTPDYVEVRVSCICPPCPPVGPPGPPNVNWSPANVCSSPCFQATVSPAATTAYTSVASAVQFGSNGCAPGPEGPRTTTNFLVKVESCAPAKTDAITQSQKIAKPTFNMYPNPTTDKVFVELPDNANYQISLMDVSGKIMKQIENRTDSLSIEINVQDLPKGMYIMTVQNETTQSIKKLIIE